jgi:hypothetical protein
MLFVAKEPGVFDMAPQNTYILPTQLQSSTGAKSPAVRWTHPQ